MSRDTEAVDVITQLNELMGALRQNVHDLNMILTPEVPDDDTT